MMWTIGMIVVIALAVVNLVGWSYYAGLDKAREAIGEDVYGLPEAPPHYRHPRDVRDLAVEADEGGRLAHEWEDWQRWDRVV